MTEYFVHELVSLRPLISSMVQVAEINTNTVISLATVLVLITAAWKLSATLTQICEQIKPLSKLPEKMARIERQVAEVVTHVEGLEEDVNVLWTSARGEPLSTIRHRTRRPWTRPVESDEDA